MTLRIIIVHPQLELFSNTEYRHNTYQHIKKSIKIHTKAEEAAIRAPVRFFMPGHTFPMSTAILAKTETIVALAF